MLYWLLYEQLYPAVSGRSAFSAYVTSRTLFASLTSLFLCVILGPWLIRKLREFQIGQHIREDGPKSHQKKAGTPTMGGVLIIISIVVPTLLWADLRTLYVWIAMFALLAFGVIGFIDDYAKVMNKRNLGLTARQKLALQMLVAGVITGVLAIMQYYGAYTTTLNVPFLKQFQPDLADPLADGQSVHLRRSGSCRSICSLCWWWWDRAMPSTSPMASTASPSA